MSSEKFCLRWNDFEQNISGAFKELRDDKDFFDITLACEDEQIQAHKVILSACSPFFRNVLRRNQHQHPLLYLRGVKYSDLQSVLNFMYHGEVNVAQEELNSFLSVAEDLRVKGLTQNNSGTSSQSKNSSFMPRTVPQNIPKTTTVPKKLPPPSSQVKTYSQDDDEIQEVVPVKTEPRENVSAMPHSDLYHSAGTDSHHATPSIPSSSVMTQDNQQLQQLDDSMQYAGDENYDDYGQYGAEGGYDTGLTDQESHDSNKGEILFLSVVGGTSILILKFMYER